MSPTALHTFLASDSTARKTLAFGTPLAQWFVASPTDLRQALARVEQAQRDGYFVSGFLSYEAARAFDPVHQSNEPGTLPLAWFAAYRAPESPMEGRQEFSLSRPKIAIEREDYLKQVRLAQAHIAKGDIYQVNFTARAKSDFSGDAWSAFCSLSRAVPVPYSAYLDLGSHQLLSLSPELFLERRGNTLLSRPMKGTAPRKPAWADDEAARAALSHSEKDRAENIMIVDLVRNDIGRVCKTGSVHVSELCKVERHPTVHQMTSLVAGELREGVTLWEIFAATFPPGSVTGAPKIRAMEIIVDLETSPRGIYCGSICLFMPGGDFVCNVAIRTLELCGNTTTLGIGSGIVSDSNPEREWDEVLLKSRFAEERPKEFALYESFRYVPGVPFQSLRSHLRRLKHSCDYFSRPFPIQSIKRALREVKNSLGDQPNRIRLDIEEEKAICRLIPEELAWPEDGVIVMLANTRVSPEDARLYHKTTLRPEKYVLREKAKLLGAQECIFVNTRGEFTEGTIANYSFKVDDKWITPSLACGLLPGVWRSAKIESGGVHEGIVRLDELSRVQEIHIGNSVRGEQRVIEIISEDGQVLYRYKP
ncbi:aminodeoxychorismate synthase component I [bacterium]|nr:aminodeoxychorismate synthase component I [bacterium]